MGIQRAVLLLLLAGCGPKGQPVRVTLTTGDKLVVEIGAGSEDGLNFVGEVYGRRFLRYDQVHSISFGADSNPPPSAADLTTDLIISRNGDHNEGVLLTVSPEGITYKSKRLDRTVSMPISKAKAICLAEVTAPPKPPAGSLVGKVSTIDGSSLQGVLMSFDDRQITLKDLYGLTYSLSTLAVSSFSFPRE